MYKTRNSALNKAIDDVTRMFGKNAVLNLAALPSPTQDTITTGSFALDIVVGNNGLPRGQIIEIFGNENSGKTSLALLLAKQFLKKDPVLYIDADHGISRWLLFVNGIMGYDNLYFANAETLEEAFEICRCAAPHFSAIIIDTLEALPLQRELHVISHYTAYNNRNLDEIFSAALPKLKMILCKSGCNLIMVNQVYDDPKVLSGDPSKSTGGEVLRYYAAVSLRTYRDVSIKRKGQIIGFSSRIKVVKNKYSSPCKEAVICWE